MLNAFLLLAAPPSWSLVAGGDIMYYAKDPERPSVRAIAPAFRAADLAYANLEVPLTRATTRTDRKSAKEIRERRQFVLRGDPGFVNHLTGLGLDVVSLANNHTMDFGPAGMREVTRLLDRAGIAHKGAGENALEAERPAVVTLKGGLRVAIISFLAFMSPGALWKC